MLRCWSRSQGVDRTDSQPAASDRTVAAEPARKTQFLNREAVRSEVSYNSPETGAQRGYLAVIFGKSTALMIGVSAPTGKQEEIAKLEAILGSLAVEARSPAIAGAAPAKTGNRCGFIADGRVPAAIREAMTASEALIRIQDEILNPPPAGVDENGKPLSPEATRAAYEAQNAALAALPAQSLERWRASRNLAVLAGASVGPPTTLRTPKNRRAGSHATPSCKKPLSRRRAAITKRSLRPRKGKWPKSKRACRSIAHCPMT